MNKKVLTLCAGFLLAGGMFSTLSAKSLAEVAGDGKYYKIAIAAASQSANTYVLDGGQDRMPGWWSNMNGVESDFDGSAWWTIEAVKDPVTGEPLAYRLKNAEGTYYTVTDADGKVYKDFYQTNSAATSSTSNYWMLKTYEGVGASGQFVLQNATTSTEANGWGINVLDLTPAAYNADFLNGILGNGFGLQICKQVIKADGSIDTDAAPVEYTDLVGNPFTGILVAKDAVGGGVELYQGSTTTGKKIVLTKDTWGTQGGGTTQEGYIFKAVTNAELTKLNDNNKFVTDVFTITTPATVAGEPLEVAVTINEEGQDYKYELVVTNPVADEWRLTVAKPTADVDAQADFTYIQGTRTNQNTYVKFGLSNAVDYSDFYGKLWNITKKGEVASPECNNKMDDFITASQVALAYPEGQWLYNANSGYFVNRESGEELELKGLRYVEGKDNVYLYNGEEVSITPAGDPSDKATLGYLNGYTEDQLRQKAFFIGTPIASTGDTVYLAKAANGNLEFTTDKTDAVEFRLTMADFTAKGQTPSTTAQNITEYTAWKDKNAGVPEQKNDIVSFHQYTISEASTEDVLYYNSKEQRFALGDKEKETPYQPIVFKNKGTDLYNLLRDVKKKVVYDADLKGYKVDANAFCSAKKLTGDQNQNKLIEKNNAYAFVDNDLFVIVDADAQQYRGDFSNTGVLDTIKVFRNSDNSYVLYEKGDLLNVGDQHEGFLGMENINDPEYADMHAAMLADTAFYSNTYRPQYMLAVDADIVNDGWTCPLNPEHNTQAWRDEHGGHCADAVQDRPYIQGRYLVNLVDSAKAAMKADVKFADNKFVHEYYDTPATPYYRLGFVQAKHIGDSLIIASTNDTIDLKNNPKDQVCTFAFKYVDAERDAFTIETLYDYETAKDDEKEIINRIPGYIKYQNGVPVVTRKASEAWVFDLEETSEIPTANETIENAAEATVSVVATDGAVIVKGAEGKNVVVSTILGKVVANEVLNSDNETIAAPAGIVVVSVDGESFKVAVK